jgi:xanthine dehydrogenase accessory factor
VAGTGSIPQQPGAKMLVTAQGLHTGTIGGGKIEFRALDEAKALLAGARDPAGPCIQFSEWHLNRDLGMSCGGSVKLVFEVINARAWQIVVYGAGHIAQALIPMLLTLDCQVTCIDSRAEWLANLPVSPRLTLIRTDDMPATVADLPEDACVLLMTMGHGSDLPVLLEILKTRQFPYLGVIGSRAKAARLKKDLTEAGLPAACSEAFFCPVGLTLGNNQPQEIAISIAAQLLKERDRSRNSPQKSLYAECHGESVFEQN